MRVKSSVESPWCGWGDIGGTEHRHRCISPYVCVGTVFDVDGDGVVTVDVKLQRKWKAHLIDLEPVPAHELATIDDLKQRLVRLGISPDKIGSICDRDALLAYLPTEVETDDEDGIDDEADNEELERWEQNFTRHRKFFRRVAKIAALNTGGCVFNLGLEHRAGDSTLHMLLHPRRHKIDISVPDGPEVINNVQLLLMA